MQFLHAGALRPRSPKSQSPREAFAHPVADASTPDRGKVPRWLVLLASNLFDAATTDAVLQRGGHEVNPLMAPFAGHRAALYGVKTGEGLIEAWLLDQIAKRHRTGANVAAASIAGLNTAVGAHNLAQR